MYKFKSMEKPSTLGNIFQGRFMEKLGYHIENYPGLPFYHNLVVAMLLGEEDTFDKGPEFYYIILIIPNTSH